MRQAGSCQAGSWMSHAAADPRAVFGDPLTIVELLDLPYTSRLSLLQRWLELSARDGEGYERWAEILGAIEALEGRASLQMDQPDETPEVITYGVVRPTDHREK